MIFVKGKNTLKEALDKGPSSLSGVHSPKSFQGIIKEFCQSYGQDTPTLLIFSDEDSLDDFLKDCPIDCCVLRGFWSKPLLRYGA